MDNLDHMVAVLFIKSAVELLKELREIASEDQQEAIDELLAQIEEQTK